MIYDAELALRDGDQLRAADDYLVCLRIAVQIPHFAILSVRNDADKLQVALFNALSDNFARHRFTDPAAVHDLLAGLVAADSDRWPLTQTLRAEYAAARDWLGSTPDEQKQSYLGTSGPTAIPPLTLTGMRWRDPLTVGETRLLAPPPLRILTALFARKVHALDSDPLGALRNEIAEDRTSIPELTGLVSRDAPLRLFVRDEAFAVARLRGVTLQTALLAYRLDHHAFPPTLDALIPKYLSAIPLDPFDGQPLRFRRDPQGVTLWSIGPDFTDQSGRIPLTPRDANRGTPGDLVWSLPAPK